MNKIKLGNKDIYYQVFYKNIKNMYLRVKEDLIIITCNKLMKQTQIEAFIIRNQQKILKTLSKIEAKVPLYQLDTMSIFGKNVRIHSQYSCKKNTYVVHDDSIHICFKNEQFDSKYMEKIYQTLLLDKMKQLQIELKYDFGTIINIDNLTLKTQLMKSRYGSCIPSKRIIKLNSILARFDDHFTRVIFIHELIHLKVSNHQKDFYKYIHMWIPNYRSTIKEIHQLSRKYVI